jgi:hypothetical protein
LYCIAEKNPKEKLNNIVWYDSIKQLSNKIYNVCNYKISVSTISRILNAK